MPTFLSIIEALSSQIPFSEEGNKSVRWSRARSWQGLLSKSLNKGPPLLIFSCCECQCAGNAINLSFNRIWRKSFASRPLDWVRSKLYTSGHSRLRRRLAPAENTSASFSVSKTFFHQRPTKKGANLYILVPLEQNLEALIEFPTKRKATLF